MKNHLISFACLFSTLIPLSAEELIKTTEFSQGKGVWQGQGTVVHVSASGEKMPRPSSDTSAVLRITLSNNRWSILETRVRLDRGQSSAVLEISLQTSSDFAPKADSKEYSDEDFSEGGRYSWSARIFTKAGLLIQLSENGGWNYRPKALRAASGWQTVETQFKKLKSHSRETLALCLPPGTGHVDIKSISLDVQ